MIQARHTLRGKLVCSFYAGYKLNRAFSSIRIIGENINEELPVLIISNHFSWWDGFIQYRLNREVFGKKFHVMMLEEQLKKYMILNEGGAFSIHKNSRDIMHSLQYGVDLMKDKNNMLLLFPQGKIESLYTHPIKFEKGLGYLLKHIQGEVQLVFNVNLVDYFSKPQPSLHIYFTCCSSVDMTDIKLMEHKYNLYMEQCKLQQTEQWV